MEKYFQADLSGSQHLFKILPISFTVKNSENVKSGCFEKCLRWRAPTLFRKEVGR